MKFCHKSTCNCEHHRLMEYLREKKNDQAQRLLAQVENGPNLRDKAGLTLLHYSVRFRNPIITKYLLQNGYNVDAQDNEGTTALMMSVTNRDFAICLILLAYNANIHLKNEAMFSSLELAVHCVFDMLNTDTMRDSKTILEMFVAKVEKEFESTHRLPYNYEIKLALVTMGSKDTVQFILKRGFSRLREREKLMALHWAMILVKPDNVALLLDWQGNDVLYAVRGFTDDYLGKFSWEDREKAILRVWMKFISDNLELSDEFRNSSRIEIEELLVRGEKEDLKIVLQEVDTRKLALRSECTFVHLLVENPNDDIMQILDDPRLQWRVDEGRMDGKTPLMIAAYHHRLAKMRFLLYQGANVNALSHREESALCVALQRAELDEGFEPTLCDVWKLLLQHGADVQRSFGDAESVIDICRPYGELEKVVVAHLALLHSHEPPALRPTFRAALDADPLTSRHFNLCLRQLAKMKEVRVHVDVTIWKLLTANQRQLLKYARNREVKPALNIIMLSYMYFVPYFIDTIYERLEKAIHTVSLEPEALSAIEKLTGMYPDAYYFVFRRVIDYLSLSDLHNLVKSGKGL